MKEQSHFDREKKTSTMSDQLNMGEIRQRFLCQLDTSEQIIRELSEAELEKVAGGLDPKFILAGLVGGGVSMPMLSDTFAFQKQSKAAKEAAQSAAR